MRSIYFVLIMLCVSCKQSELSRDSAAHQSDRSRQAAFLKEDITRKLEYRKLAGHSSVVIDSTLWQSVSQLPRKFENIQVMPVPQSENQYYFLMKNTDSSVVDTLLISTHSITKTIAGEEVSILDYTIRRSPID